MKKLLIILFSLLLTGCSAADLEKDRSFMVSSLGFSQNDEEIKVDAEIIIVNSESAESEPEHRVISGSGSSVKGAIESIAATLSRPILLEHCAVLAIGKEISPYWVDKICDYCFDDKRITISAYMISADNPAELFSLDPESSVAVGYDLMGIIERQKSIIGAAYSNRYFEVESRREKKENYVLPHFSKTEQGILIDGITVFEKDRAVEFLENSKSSVASALKKGGK